MSLVIVRTLGNTELSDKLNYLDILLSPDGYCISKGTLKMSLQTKKIGQGFEFPDLSRM